MEWKIPDNSPDSTIILPGEFMLLWADKDSEQGPLHANFKLNVSGEEIAIFSNDGQTLIDYVEFGSQTPDVSYGRISAGNPNWQLFTESTPGWANGAISANSDIMESIPILVMASIIVLALAIVVYRTGRKAKKND